MRRRRAATARRASSMPTLARLRGEGVECLDTHAAVPPVTRINGASIGTGGHPGTHGLVGNRMSWPAVREGRAPAARRQIEPGERGVRVLGQRLPAQHRGVRRPRGHDQRRPATPERAGPVAAGVGQTILTTYGRPPSKTGERVCTRDHGIRHRQRLRLRVMRAPPRCSDRLADRARWIGRLTTRSPRGSRVRTSRRIGVGGTGASVIPDRTSSVSHPSACAPAMSVSIRSPTINEGPSGRLRAACRRSGGFGLPAISGGLPCPKEARQVEDVGVYTCMETAKGNVEHGGDLASRHAGSV